MADILIGIAAHSSRLDAANALRERTAAEILNIDNTQPSEQTSLNGAKTEAVIACAENHLTVLCKLWNLAREHTWCIVLEDDALPIDNFRTHVANALNHAPCPVVGFYVGEAGSHYNLKARKQALETSKAWLIANDLLSAVAYAVYLPQLPSILNYYTACHRERSVEERFTGWATACRSSTCGPPRFCYTVPCLVDHSEGASLIFGNQIRRAWSVGVARDWDTQVEEYHE